MKRAWIVVALLAGALGVVIGLLPKRRLEAASPCGCCAGVTLPPAPPPVPEDGQERLGPPEPGEWREKFPEPPQSFEQYAASSPNRKCPHRTTFYLQPLTAPPGRRSMMDGADARYERAIELLREYAEIFFSVPAKALPAIPMFDKTYDAARGQCDASAVTDLLADRIPSDALVYIGIAQDDLYSGKLNFVFGVGSLSRRTGVYSLRRYQTKDETLFRRRALKLMTHEVGHILSIHHCVTWRCLMQGANSLPEDDTHPMSLCPIDLRKLEWNTGFNRTEWYRRIGEFYRRTGLTDDAAWVESRLKK